MPVSPKRHESQESLGSLREMIQTPPCRGREGGTANVRPVRLRKRGILCIQNQRALQILRFQRLNPLAPEPFEIGDGSWLCPRQDGQKYEEYQRSRKERGRVLHGNDSDIELALTKAICAQSG